MRRQSGGQRDRSGSNSKARTATRIFHNRLEHTSRLLTQSTVFNVFNIFELTGFLLTPRFPSTYVHHHVWHDSCLRKRCRWLESR